MKKKWTAICLAIVFVFGCTTAWGNEKIQLKVNSKYINTSDADIFVDDQGRTQVPLRALAEALHYGVIWDSDSNSALLFTIEQNGNKAQCYRYTVGSKEVEKMTIAGQGFTVNDTIDSLSSKITMASDPEKVLTMDTAPQIVAQRTFIPVRYVAELFNNNVVWDSDANTVLISNK